MYGFPSTFLREVKHWIKVRGCCMSWFWTNLQIVFPNSCELSCAPCTLVPRFGTIQKDDFVFLCLFFPESSKAIVFPSILWRKAPVPATLLPSLRANGASSLGLSIWDLLPVSFDPHHSHFVWSVHRAIFSLLLRAFDVWRGVLIRPFSTHRHLDRHS